MEHDVIAKFVEQRRSRTFGQEPTLGVKPATWNLHAQDPKRAVTSEMETPLRPNCAALA